MLIKDHTTYSEAFRAIAANHKLLHHGKTAAGDPDEKETHFVRAVISRHPLLASPDLEEFLKKSMGSGLKFPAMVLVAYTGSYPLEHQDHKRKGFQGEFIILDRVKTEDWNDQEEKLTLTETIGEEVISHLDLYYESNIAEGRFIWKEAENEKIFISEKKLAGTKFYFNINVPFDDSIKYNPSSFFEPLEVE